MGRVWDRARPTPSPSPRFSPRSSRYRYQRYVYRVDMSRVNEFGQSGDGEAAKAKKPGKPATAAAKKAAGAAAAAAASEELPAEEAKMLTRQGAALRKRGGDGGGGAKGSPKGSKKTS